MLWIRVYIYIYTCRMCKQGSTNIKWHYENNNTKYIGYTFGKITSKHMGTR